MKAEIVAQALISTWFGVFGPPNSIISDQECDNKKFIKFCNVIFKVAGENFNRKNTIVNKLIYCQKKGFLCYQDFKTNLSQQL
jgi:hypothetical protein